MSGLIVKIRLEPWAECLCDKVGNAVQEVWSEGLWVGYDDQIVQDIAELLGRAIVEHREAIKVTGPHIKEKQ